MTGAGKRTARAGDAGASPAPPSRTSLPAKLALAGFGILVVFGLLFVTELALGIAGYGPPTRLFLRKRLGGEEVHQLNRDIGRLFFPKWVERPMAHVHLPVRKDPGAFRIMATGASTTLGDPFGYQTAFPALLGEMLGDVAPRRRYEIANCACIAISSLDVLAIHKQALGYDPDAILIYCGHNEAYGADGIDTPMQRSFQSRGAAKFWLWLRNRRLVRLLRDTVAPAKPPADVDPGQEGFGMWVMRDRLVPACAEKHARMLRFYRENILEMLSSARSAGVDVILCTLVSNARDQSPLGAAHGCAFREADAPRWQEAYDRGVGHMERGEWEPARAALADCRALDPEYALVRFRLGRCLDALGDSAAALAEYVAARDFDPVHFRACSDENDVLRKIAREWDTRSRHRVVFVDLDSLFYADFPHGAGREFFTEHVHPYPEGHAWIAARIVDALAESPLAPELGPWDLSRRETLASYPERAGMSALDVAAGLYLTDLHKLAKWPFTSCYDQAEQRAEIQGRIAELQTRMNPFELQIFAGIPADQTGDYYDFGKRHYSLFTMYRAQRQAEPALRELLLARRYWPPLAAVETDMAQIMVGTRRLDEAERFLARARELDPTHAPIHFVSGALHHGRGELDAARREFETYLAKEPGGPYAAAASRGLSALSAPPPRGR